MRRVSEQARHVQARDGVELRMYRWPAVGRRRASLLLVHGVAEHAGRYPHVGSRLASAGIATHAFDLRGFGGSGGHRAFVHRWSEYHDDVEDRLAELRSAADGLPAVLYGHSMGGLIALGYVLADPPRPLPDLLVLSAPAIDAVVPAWKRRLADILSATVPRFAIANTFPKGALSSDPTVEAAYLADPLAVHRTTARLGVALFREQDRVKSVLARGGALPVTTYVVHGADDPLVPEWASRSLEGRPNVTRRVYPRLRHETHNEPSGAAVIDDTIAWIGRQVGGDAHAPATVATRDRPAQMPPRGMAHFRRTHHAGLYESFFAKACHPAGGVALWIRYTVHRRPGHEPNGSLWLTLFDAGAGAPLATKETLPADALSDEPYLRIGASSFAPGRIQGRTLTGLPASWDLTFGPGDASFRHLPQRLYDAALPRTKLESLHPSTRLTGTAVIGDRRVELDGWPATIGHNWGTEHAERWIWVHAAGFEGRTLDSWIDVAIGRVRIGPITSPWLANGAISLDGVRHRLGGFGRVHQTKVAASATACDLSLRGKEVSVEAHVSADLTRSVGWLYADPRGSSHHVLNNSIADLALRVKHAADPAAVVELRLRGAATYEIGLRPSDHGVPLQPFADG